MITYVYEREDGTQFEYKQRISDEPLTVCPDTGQPVFRVIQPAPVHYKGNGWYVTDYGTKKETKKK